MENIFCAICGFSLDSRASADGVEWTHPIAAPRGHPATPVPYNELTVPPVILCDFCSEPGTWTFPCATFDTALGATSVGAWCACQTCHDLIVVFNYEALSERSFTTTVAAHGPMPEGTKILLSITHLQFHANRTGDPVPGFDEGLQS